MKPLGPRIRGPVPRGDTGRLGAARRSARKFSAGAHDVIRHVLRSWRSVRRSEVLVFVAAALLFGTTGTAGALGPDDASTLSVGVARMVVGGIGLAAIQGARQAKAGRIIAIDTNPSKFELARQFGATQCINPKDHDKPIQQVLIEMTGWGIDHTFECIGNVHVMRAALESAHRGWGQSIVIGVAGAGEEISTRPFQLVTGRVWKGSAFGGVKGRTQLPGMVEDAMRGDIDLAPFVTHTMGLEEINEAFDLMHAGRSIRSVVVY